MCDRSQLDPELLQDRGVLQCRELVSPAGGTRGIRCPPRTAGTEIKSRQDHKNFLNAGTQSMGPG